MPSFTCRLDCFQLWEEKLDGSERPVSVATWNLFGSRLCSVLGFVFQNDRDRPLERINLSVARWSPCVVLFLVCSTNVPHDQAAKDNVKCTTTTRSILSTVCYPSSVMSSIWDCVYHGDIPFVAHPRPSLPYSDRWLDATFIV